MSRTLTSEQITLSKSLIESAQRVVISTHRSPDGDAIGSALGLYHALRVLGKDVQVILTDGAPEFLQWIPGYAEVIILEDRPNEVMNVLQGADLLFVLDYNQYYRTGEAMETLLQQTRVPVILIDHHQQPGDFPNVCYSDTSACSTAEMVYRFLEQLAYKHCIDDACRQALYCGIMTDSGSFRFPTVSADTHRIAGEMIEAGLDHAHVHRMVYDTNMMDKLRLVGYALSQKLIVLPEAATAYITLTADELKQFNYKQGDTEGLVNQALSIQGVKLAAFFREGNNEIKASFRSKGSFDVNAYARRHWQGGGHINAAGGKSDQDMTTTIEKFEQLTLQMQDQIAAS